MSAWVIGSPPASADAAPSAAATPLPMPGTNGATMAAKRILSRTLSMPALASTCAARRMFSPRKAARVVCSAKRANGSVENARTVFCIDAGNSGNRIPAMSPRTALNATSAILPSGIERAAFAAARTAPLAARPALLASLPRKRSRSASPSIANSSSTSANASASSKTSVSPRRAKVAPDHAVAVDGRAPMRGVVAKRSTGKAWSRTDWHFAHGQRGFGMRGSLRMAVGAVAHSRSPGQFGFTPARGARHQHRRLGRGRRRRAAGGL